MSFDLIQVAEQGVAVGAANLGGSGLHPFQHLVERRGQRGEVRVQTHGGGSITTAASAMSKVPRRRANGQTVRARARRMGTFGGVPNEPVDRGTLTPIDLRGIEDVSAHLPRPSDEDERPTRAVREIIDDVRSRGDAALRELTQRFDGVTLAELRVDAATISDALASIPVDVREALELAAERITAHHQGQRRGDIVHSESGVSVRTVTRAVRSAGCYVPGGRAAYPSTVLMTAVPARVAGVQRVVVCVPPDRETGGVAPVTLAAAAVAGVDEVYAVGGAQAIAAMAYGTESIAAVDVVCGPGNLFVAVAKQEVAGQVGVAAAFAGPSEVVVIADGSVAPDLVAIDLMLQAEHGPDGLAWLVSWEPEVVDRVGVSLRRLIADAPRRVDIAATLERCGYSVLVDSPDQALAVSDLVAPEHLELLCVDADRLAAEVTNAGAVFCGPWSPASIGDYVAGPSHVLPTHGSARFASALTVEDFTKHVHIVTATPEGFDAIGPAAATLAEAEGLRRSRRIDTSAASSSAPRESSRDPSGRSRRDRAHGRLPLTATRRPGPTEHQRGAGTTA